MARAARTGSYGNRRDEDTRLTRATAPRPSFTVQGSGGAVAGAVVASSSSLSPVVREERAQPHASSGPRHAFTSLSTRDVENAKYFPSGVVPGSA
jgi:hypothetical protein